MVKYSLLARIGALALSSAATLAYSDVDFMQSDFPGGHVQEFVTLGSAPLQSQFANPLAGGNPGSWGRFAITTPAGNGRTWGIVTNSDWIYNPSVDGGIFSVACDADCAATQSGSAVLWSILKQDNNYYVLYSGNDVGPWVPESVLGYSYYFSKINPVTGSLSAEHPDFFGSPVQLGFAFDAQHSGATNSQYSGLDNLHFHLATYPPVSVNQINILQGSQLQGGLAQLMSSDDQDLFVINDTDSLLCSVEFVGVYQGPEPRTMRFKVEGHATRFGLANSISLYNWSASSYVEMIGAEATTIDAAVGVEVPSYNYIQGGTGTMKARLDWAPVNDEDPSQDGWVLATDYVQWLLG